MTSISKIVAAFVAKTGTNRGKQTDAMMQGGNTLSDYIARMSQLEKRYAGISRKLGIPPATYDYSCDMTRLTLKMKSLLPCMLEHDITQCKLEKIIRKCSEMLDAMEANPAASRHTIAINVKHFIEYSIDEIEIIKILTR